MKTLITIGNVCLIFITVIAILVSLGFVYYHFFVNDSTIGANNVGDQIALDIVNSEDLTEEEVDEMEERWFMQANYYSNDKHNGVEIQELQYNYFTGYNLTENEYRSTGMQYIGDFSTYTYKVSGSDEANSRVLDEFYYYDTTNGISWSGFKGHFGGVGSMLNRNQQFIIKIDNRPFSIQLDGGYRIDHKGPLGIITWWYEEHYFDYGDVFDSVFSAIKSNNKGYGDYYITLDLSQYFSIKEYDSATGKFKSDDVTNIIKNFAVLKFHYDENGARNSKQSLFGIIECNSKYDISDDIIDTTYWQERVNYTLNVDSKLNGEDIFVYRYSESYDGYFISLTMDVKTLFSKMPRAKVSIVLDLNKLAQIGVKVVGLDYNAFEAFQIDILTIVGNSQTFYMLDRSLWDTQLRVLQYSREITFDFADNVTNSNYTGVLV